MFALCKPLVLIVLFASLTFQLLQPSSTAAQTEIACTVEPRDADDVAALSQQAASGVMATPEASPESSTGPAVSDEVIVQLENTLRMVESCTKANDIPRLTALFTEEGALKYLFSPEMVKIIEGTPPADAISAVEMTKPVGEIFISKAILLPDGRILATVSLDAHDKAVEYVWFKEVDGMYRIDSVQPVKPTHETGSASPEVTILENQVIAIVRDQLQLPENAEISVTVDPVDWPDSALGCPEEGGVYLAVVTPGYRITIQAGDQTLEFHTDMNGAIVQCEAESDSS